MKFRSTTSAMHTQIAESATLKMAKFGTEMKSTTCPEPKPGSRKRRSKRLPQMPPSRPPNARVQDSERVRRSR